MRIATGTFLSGIVLLVAAVVGVEPTISFAVGLAALVTGAIALAVTLEARDPAPFGQPAVLRADQRRH